MMRVLLADDHEMVREGLRRVLEEDDGIEVVAEAANGLDAVRRAADTRPDVVVMDVGMALMNGLDATSLIVQRGLARVVMLSVHDDEDTVMQAFQAGATGYVHKSAAGRELIDALQAVQGGQVFVTGTVPVPVRERVMQARRDRRAADRRLGHLTRRQRQVLQLVAEGHKNKEMASLLGVSVETVKSHRKGLMKRLGIRTVAGLTHYAREMGLVRRPSRTRHTNP